MTTHILVTGANSGLGLDAARQLLTRPTGTVWISARSQAKADGAVAVLAERTGAARERIRTVLFDLLEPPTIHAALDGLQAEGVVLDGVVLNAGGMSPPDGDTLPLGPDGTTKLFAMNVGGHAHLVRGLLAGSVK